MRPRHRGRLNGMTEEQRAFICNTVRDAVLATKHEGIGAMEVAKLIHQDWEDVKAAIACLEETAQIERSTDTGRYVKYGAPGIYKAHEHVRARTKAIMERYGHWSKEPFDSAGWVNAPIVHRIVKATEAEPIRVTGPTSVWGLA